MSDMSRKPKKKNYNGDGKNSIYTPNFELAGHVHNAIFNTLYKFPAEFTFGKCISLKVNSFTKQNFFKYLPWLIAEILVTFVTGFGSCVLMPLVHFIRPQNFISITHIAICIVLGTCSVLEWGPYIAAWLDPTGVHAINLLFAFERKEFKSIEASPTVKILGLVILSMQIQWIFIIPLLTAVATLANLDPFYLVFEFIQEHRYYRSRSTIFSVLGIRFFLGLVSVFEFARFNALVLTMVLVIGYTIRTCLNKLTKPDIKTSERETLRLYTHLRVILKRAEFLIQNCIWILLTTMHIIMVTLVWFSLKCHDILPDFVYYTILFFTASVVSILVVLVPIIVVVNVESENFVCSQRAKFHTFSKYSERRYLYAKWKSQRMLPIRYGQYFLLTNETPMAYLSALMDDITNAVLLIDP